MPTFFGLPLPSGKTAFRGVYVVTEANRAAARSLIAAAHRDSGGMEWFIRPLVPLVVPDHGVPSLPTHYLADVRIDSTMDGAFVDSLIALCDCAWHLSEDDHGCRTLAWSKHGVSDAKNGTVCQDPAGLLADAGLAFLDPEINGATGDPVTLFLHVSHNGTAWRIFRQSPDGWEGEENRYPDYATYATKDLAVTASQVLGNARAVLGLQTEVVKHLLAGGIQDRSSYGF